MEPGEHRGAAKGLLKISRYIQEVDLYRKKGCRLFKKMAVKLAVALFVLAGVAAGAFCGVCPKAGEFAVGNRKDAAVLAAAKKSPAGKYYGALQVKGAHLCDSSGKPVQLRGVSAHGLAWYPQYVNQKLVKELHQKWNVNAIRLAMYTAEYGGYCAGGDQKQLKKLIDQGIAYATKEQMYAIIDWHILSDGNPNTYLSEAKKFFKEMSKKYAGHENVIYEICNEPNGGAGWADIKSYAKKVISVIRKNDKDAVILVGTPNWCQFVNEAAADPIKNERNIMYTLHFYAATHKDDLRGALKNAYKAGLPMFVSEYGICEASGNGNVDKKEADKWIKLLDECKISYVAWNLSNKNEASAMIDPSCTKTHGFTKKELSAQGKWVFDTYRKAGW